MTPKLRLWQRDADITTETTRSPLLTSQIARLLGFPSRKKAAERLCPLYRAGLVKRVAYFQPAMQGKPEFVYFTGARPHPRTLPHTIAVADVRVQLAEWLRNSPEYTAEFFYAHERQTTSGIIPDATIVVHKASKTGLVFVEVDNGTESVTSPNGYSLASKLGAYAAYFDDESYRVDFPTARGFRVGLIVPAGRLRHVQQLVAHEHHDFVLSTTTELLNAGLHRRVWWTHDGCTVDVFGRAQADVVGEMVAPAIPATHRGNA